MKCIELNPGTINNFRKLIKQGNLVILVRIDNSEDFDLEIPVVYGLFNLYVTSGLPLAISMANVSDLFVSKHDLLFENKLLNLMSNDKAKRLADEAFIDFFAWR